MRGFWFLIFGILGVAVQTGCGGGGGAAPQPTPPTGPPAIQFSVVGSADLGNAVVGGDAAEETWQFENTGEVPLRVEAVDIEGPHAGDFSFLDLTLPLDVQPGAQVQVTLCFHPTHIGQRGASVRVRATGEEGQEEAQDVAVSANAIMDPILFTDVTDAAGIVTTHGGGFRIGQAWGDVNRDGYLDLFVTVQGGSDKLFFNDGDGTFTESGMDFPTGDSSGAVFGDYDNDGWVDLYVCVRLGPNFLYRNVEGTLVDVTEAAGVGDLAKGSVAAWADFDKDGDLDLYAANYDKLQPDVLYENQGDGTFAIVTHYLDVSPIEDALAVSFVDYDNDDDLDIYIVVDSRNRAAGLYPYFTRNLLFRNDGATASGWAFTEVAEAAGADLNIEGMGLAIGDYDLNGTLDFHMTDVGPAEFLHNNGNGTFTDRAAASGTDFDAVTWGTVFADFDLDGYPDLFVASSETANVVYRNRGDGTFEDVSDTAAPRIVRPTLGVAYADYDMDGDVDLVVGNHGVDYRIYRNEANPEPNEWLGLRLHGAGPIHKQAIGTRATLVLDDGRRLMQEVKNGSSLGAGNDLAFRWGFGGATPLRLEIKWTDGTTETLTELALGTEMQHTYPTE